MFPDISDGWLSDLDELLALGRASPLSIVLALDSNTWKALSTRPARTTKTELEQRAKVLFLDLLKDDEFDVALDLLLESTSSQPYRGARYNIEYREPRVLRVIAASIHRRGVGSEAPLMKFPSTTTTNEVNLAWDAFVKGN